MHSSYHAKASLIAAMVVLLVLDAMALVARVYVRVFMIKAFWWDDATLCLSFLGYILACIMGFLSIYFGYAYDGPSGDWPHYNPARAAQFLYANQLTLYLTSGVVKVAVALVLLRLAFSKRYRVTLIISVVVVLIWTFVTTLFSSWLCLTNGTTSYVSSSTCTVVGQFRTISNIFIDFFYSGLPILIIRKANMNFRLKLSVCLLLGLGLVASTATIVKLVIILRLPTAEGEAQKILHYQLLIWADVELGLAIFCASAAALRPLLRLFSRKWGSTNPRSNPTPYGRSADARTSFDALSGTEPLSPPDRRPSHAASASGGPSGVQEYELSQMDSNRSLEQQQRYYRHHRQAMRD
ncbi:hypothetical protein Daus18300_007585 [Diaporthe australafricana]|uniref:Rhodopsin domain-containing protein n=1 Tax=Diaporthe australafricana TaxID=127596 RepID=A0ABR3WM93_9PEZI